MGFSIRVRYRYGRNLVGARSIQVLVDTPGGWVCAGDWVVTLLHPTNGYDLRVRHKIEKQALGVGHLERFGTLKRVDSGRVKTLNRTCTFIR